MQDDGTIWALEEQCWLGDSAFYEQILADDALMVLPAPAGMLDRAATIESIRAAPRWKRVAFAEQRSLRPTQDTAVLAYLAEAERGGREPTYRALCSSTYARIADSWRLVLHHQTPEPGPTPDA